MKISDEQYMVEALKLARLGGRDVAPNPMVGAVIVKNGRVIGKGYHQKFGGPHAEVNAIRSVKNQTDLIGATIYVTLEPCRHFGKTPACLRLIKDVGIQRIVCGSRDPFQKRTKDYGLRIKFLTGTIARQCRKLNKFFFTWVTKKRPFVTVKIAMSADGFVAGENGQSVHFTTASQDREIHQLRASHQAIMVGINTVLKDDPQLNVRLAKGKDPLRVILDSRLRMPRGAKVLKDGNYLIATTVGDADLRPAPGQNLRPAPGQNLRPAPGQSQWDAPGQSQWDAPGQSQWDAPGQSQWDADLRPLQNIWYSPTKKRVSLKKLFAYLAKIGISSVLVESGPTLYKSLKKQNLIDELIVYKGKKKILQGIKVDI